MARLGRNNPIAPTILVPKQFLYRTVENSGEGGSDGTTVTTGNSGGASGTAWDTVSIAAGTTLTFQDAPAGADLLTYEFAAPTTGAIFLEWDLTKQFTARQLLLWTRFYVYTPATPTAQRRLYRVRGGLPSLTTLMFARVNFTGGGAQRVFEVFDATNTVRYASTGVNEPLDSWYRVEMLWTPSLSRLFVYFDPDGTTADIDSGDLSFDFGSTNNERSEFVSYGAAGSTTAFGTMYLDNIGLTNTAKLGPLGNFGVSIVTAAAHGRAGSKQTASATVIRSAQAHGRAHPRQAAAGTRITSAAAHGRNFSRSSAVSVRIIPAAAQGRADSNQTATSTIFRIAAAHGRADSKQTAAALALAFATAHGRSHARQAATGGRIIVAQAHGRNHSRATSAGTPIKLATAHGRADSKQTATGTVFRVAAAHGRAHAKSTALSVVIDLGQAHGRAHPRQAATAAVTQIALAHGRSHARSAANGQAFSAGVVVAAAHGRNRSRAALNATLQVFATAHGRGRGRAPIDMVAPTRQTVSSSVNSTFASTQPVNLPNNINTGDFLLIVLGYTDLSNTATFADGFSKIPEVENTTGGTQGLVVAYKRVTGLEGWGASGNSTTVTFAASSRATSRTYRITGAEDPSIQAPELAAVTQNDINGTANPPNLSPTDGSNHYLWIAGYTCSGFAVGTTPPADYSNLLTVTHANTATSRGSLTTVERVFRAASDDPGVIDGGSGVEEAVAFTIVVYPSTAIVGNIVQGAARVRSKGRGTAAATTTGLQTAAAHGRAHSRTSAAALGIAAASAISRSRGRASTAAVRISIASGHGRAHARSSSTGSQFITAQAHGRARGISKWISVGLQTGSGTGFGHSRSRATGGTDLEFLAPTDLAASYVVHVYASGSYEPAISESASYEPAFVGHAHGGIL